MNPKFITKERDVKSFSSLRKETLLFFFIPKDDTWHSSTKELFNEMKLTGSIFVHAVTIHPK